MGADPNPRSHPCRTRERVTPFGRAGPEGLVNPEGDVTEGESVTTTRSLYLFGTALFFVSAPARAQQPAPLDDCADLMVAVSGFDSLGAILDELQADSFAEAFGIYIRDIQRLDGEGRGEVTRMKDVIKTQCEPYLNGSHQWTTLKTELTDEGCSGELSPEQYDACKPKVDSLNSWARRLEAKRQKAQQRIDDVLAAAVDFAARAKLPLQNADNVLNPANTEEALRLYIWWLLRHEGSPPHNSCWAFSQIATALGKRVKDQDSLIVWLSRNLVNPETPLRYLPGGEAPLGPIAGNTFSASGFKPKFIDLPSDNQVRHAAANMRVGYSLTGGPAAVYSFKNDLVARYIHAQAPEWGDYYLAIAAAQLGFRLRHGRLNASSFGEAIRSELCN
jgi:hypothetical protein